jgi:hypothetical protein
LPFFLDNNVLIGYIFETDHWNLKSLAVMNSIPTKFSSNTVLRECSEIYEKNIRIISRELQKTIAEIHRSKSLDLKKLSSFINGFYSRDVILLLFNSNPKDDKKELINGLRSLMRDTESRCLANFQRLDKLVIFCIRNQPYNEIYRLFVADGLARIDPFDVEIILDAHYVGLQVQDLFLITGDYRHIVPRKDVIKSNTSLKDVIGLGEFNFR